MASNTRTRLRAILARALNSLVWLFPRHGACEHSVHLTIVSHSNSAPSLRLPGLLHCPEGFRPLTATPECSGASRQTPASVEYLRRHAGLGQDSNPAKQYRIQLHVAIDAARFKRNVNIVLHKDVPRVETIDIGLRSVISCTRAVLPALIANGVGRIVLVGSDSGKVGTSGESVSAACRGAIIAFAKSISREYARKNVQMNVVCPGPTETQLWEDLVTNDEFGSKIGTAMVRAIPMRRLGKPEEIAAAVAFLASQQASYITGQALSVSGGLTMA